MNQKVRKEVKVLKKKTNHWLHFFLTLLTSGFWVVVWITAACCNDNAYVLEEVAVVEKEKRWFR